MTTNFIKNKPDNIRYGDVVWVDLGEVLSLIHI